MEKAAIIISAFGVNLKWLTIKRLSPILACMRITLKKISLLILMAFMLNVGLNGVVCSTMQAATVTQQQKAKEAAKKQKAKEAAKKKKAKEAEKRKKAQQKAKEQAAKQKAKEQSSKPTQSETYAQKVAEIEAYNAYVARYMSRDITHRLGIWGQIGYSNLFNSNMQYNAENQTGFSVNSKGGVGGGGGLGYQLRYKLLLVTTGVEMQVYTSLYELSGAEKGQIARSFGMTPYAGKMLYNYSFTNMQDKVQAGFVQIPVLLGMEFANKYAYFLAGPKVGVGVLGQSQVSGLLSTTITDLEAIVPYQGIASHALVNDLAYSTSSSLKWNLNLALSGEIGMSLDPWIKSKQISTRLAAFVEYGVLNIQTNLNLRGNNDQPVDYSSVLAGGHPTQDVTLVPALSTTTAASGKVNPLLVGVKATCWFNLPRKNLRVKPLPKEPLPTMLVQVVNADDSKPLSGAVVAFASPNKASVNKTTNTQGMAIARLPKGNYTITADKVGFYSDSSVYSLTRDMRDTLRLSLRPEPKPIVYTLAGRVYASDTNLPLEAEVQALNMVSNVLYSGATTTDGLFVTNLLPGQYMARVRCPGYMPLDQTIQFTQDTLSFYLTKIKEGIKVKINNLYFATNKTYILPQSEAALQDLSQFLLDNNQVRILIIGHTDNVGSDQANQILSEGRANSLRAELIKRGVDAARIEVEGKGESQPIDTNDTEEGRQNNRRVEFMILSSGNADIKQIR